MAPSVLLVLFATIHVAIISTEESGSPSTKREEGLAGSPFPSDTDSPEEERFNAAAVRRGDASIYAMASVQNAVNPP